MQNQDNWQRKWTRAQLIFADETTDFLAEGIPLETAGGSGSSHQTLKIKPFIGITFTSDGI